MNNIELVKSAYESFGKGDMETFKSLLSDQFVFKVPGEYSHAGVFNGADDVIENCFSKLKQNIPSFHVTPVQFWESGDTVFVKVELKSDDMSTDGLHMHVVSDGKAQSFEAFEDTQAIAKAVKS